MKQPRTSSLMMVVKLANMALIIAFSPCVWAQVHRFTSPNQQVTGFFGETVSPVPDVTGDGIADIIIGATGELPRRAYLYNGVTRELIRTLADPNTLTAFGFGWAVAGLEDVTGDGLGEVVIGAYEDAPGGSPALSGRVYVINGGSGALVRALKGPEEKQGNGFGYAVSVVGDVNFDGKQDILVGEPFADPGKVVPQDAGRAYVYSGTDGTLLQTLFPSNQQTRAYFGWSVAGSSDMNADGLGDSLVGAYQETPPALPTQSGRVYLFSGGAQIHSFTSPNPTLRGYFGSSVAFVPDVNGDGVIDIIIGAERENAPGTPGESGRAHIFSGADFSHLFSVAPTVPIGQGYFGSSVAGVPDWNGDGRGDIAVGAFHEEDPPGLEGSGRAYVYSGMGGGLLRVLQTTMPTMRGNFGARVSGMPDTNGDGYAEVLVDAHHELTTGNFSEGGHAYLFLGDPITPTPTPTRTPTPSPVQTAEPSPSATPTESPVPTESLTPSPSPTPSPTPFDNATFVGSSLAAQIKAGQSFLFGVTMRNGGNTTWTAAAGYALMVLTDSCSVVAGGPISVPEGVDVLPNQSYQFISQINAPASDADCSLQFRMAHGGIEFGGFVNLAVAVRIPPNHSADWEIFE